MENVLYNESVKWLNSYVKEWTMNNATLILHAKVASNIPLDEELHTFAEWKRLGFSVKKGEKARCKIAIWNKSIKSKKDDEEAQQEDDSYFYTKVAAFFTRNQVQPLDVKE